MRVLYRFRPCIPASFPPRRLLVEASRPAAAQVHVIPMVQLTATVRNSLGIHARPAALIVQAASKFRCEILLSKDGLEVNGKSIMGVMMLAAEPNSEVGVKTLGEDETVAARELVRVIESKFD